MEVGDIRIHVAGYADSDAQERAELAWRLEEELRGLEIEGISHPERDAASGAKGSAFEWAQLIVTFAGSLPALVAAVRGWLGRHPGSSVTLEIDGDRLTLEQASLEERRELIDTWMKRHGG